MPVMRPTVRGAALLGVVVREHRAFLRDAVDVRRAITHHAVGVRADVRDTDIVAEDDEMFGFLAATGFCCACAPKANATPSAVIKG